MRILVVDDEPAFCRVVSHHLESDGYETLCARTGAEALESVRTERPDLVLLDIRLPDMDGRELCQAIREVTLAPIVVLSVLGGEDDIVRGLYAGADDYMVKPLRMEELKARVRAHLRHADALARAVGRYEDPELRIDIVSHRLEKRGRRVYLSRKEYRLLACLLEHRGNVVPAETLYQRMWPKSDQVDGRRLALYISNLRRKIEDDPKNPKYLHTARGRGYWFGRVDATDTGEPGSP